MNKDIMELCIAVFSIMAVLLILFVIWRRLHNKLRRIDKMDGIEFENFLNDILCRQGYHSELTGASHDFGADIIIEDFGEEQDRAVIQAKRYSDTVPIAAVQQVFAAMYYYDAAYSIVISNNYYSGSAVKMAEKIGVVLIDRDGLSELMKGKMLEDFVDV
jgi:restriction system protein